MPFNVPLRELDIKFHLEVRNWVRRESTFHVLVLSAAATIFVVLMSSSWTTNCLLTLFLPLQPILGNCTKFWQDAREERMRTTREAVKRVKSVRRAMARRLADLATNASSPARSAGGDQSWVSGNFWPFVVY